MLNFTSFFSSGLSFKPWRIPGILSQRSIWNILVGCCYYDNRGVSALNQLVHNILLQTGHPPPFFSLCIGCVSRYWVGRSDWKKNTKKKSRESRNKRPCYPRTTLKVNIPIFGLTKYTIYCKKKCSCFCSCFSLLCYYAHFSD